MKLNVHHIICNIAVMAALLSCIEAFANELIISKSKRTLDFITSSDHRSFPIALGTNPAGRKLKQGDRKTPEGVYFITRKNANSQFHLSLGISYPNVEDGEAGLRAGLISKNAFAKIKKAYAHKKPPPQNTQLGGDIFIHGGGTGRDWTWGCVALNNDDIAFLFQHVNVGDKVTILK